VNGELIASVKRELRVRRRSEKMMPVTGQRSNQLNYVPSFVFMGLWETLDFPVCSYCP